MKTKFYFNDMKGAPVLASEWGSLLNVFRTIAVTGFNEQIVQTYIQDGLDLTLTFTEEHGFLKDQVIAISGATDPEFNDEYEVKATTLNTITIELNTSDSITGSLVCMTPGLGWEEVFTGEQKAVFRTKDQVTNPYYLRIDDSCPVGYDPSWSKFARVTIAEGMISVDDFADFVKAPVMQSRPRDVNENGDGVTGDQGIYGWSKWYHGFGWGKNYSFTEATTNYQSSDLKYEIIGDDSSIFFMPRATTKKDSRALYVFSHIIPEDTSNVLNGFLSSHDFHAKAEYTSSYTYNSGNSSLHNQWHSLKYTGKWGLSTWNGITNTSPKFGPVCLNVGNDQQISGKSGDIPFPNPGSNSVILSDIYLKEDNNGGIRGKLPLIKWIHNRWTYGNRFILSKNKIKYIIIGNDYNNEGMTSFFAYRLER